MERWREVTERENRSTFQLVHHKYPTLSGLGLNRSHHVKRQAKNPPTYDLSFEIGTGNLLVYYSRINRDFKWLKKFISHTKTGEIV